jgi:hypothetical protein
MVILLRVEVRFLSCGEGYLERRWKIYYAVNIWSVDKINNNNNNNES